MGHGVRTAARSGARMSERWVGAGAGAAGTDEHPAGLGYPGSGLRQGCMRALVGIFGVSVHWSRALAGDPGGALAVWRRSAFVGPRPALGSHEGSGVARLCAHKWSHAHGACAVPGHGAFLALQTSFGFDVGRMP